MNPDASTAAKHKKNEAQRRSCAKLSTSFLQAEIELTTRSKADFKEGEFAADRAADFDSRSAKIAPRRLRCSSLMGFHADLHGSRPTKFAWERSDADVDARSAMIAI
jgi:hypothetical protein